MKKNKKITKGYILLLVTLTMVGAISILGASASYFYSTYMTDKVLIKEKKTSGDVKNKANDLFVFLIKQTTSYKDGEETKTISYLKEPVVGSTPSFELDSHDVGALYTAPFIKDSLDTKGDTTLDGVTSISLKTSLDSSAISNVSTNNLTLSYEYTYLNKVCNTKYKASYVITTSTSEGGEEVHTLTSFNHYTFESFNFRSVE